MCGIVGIIEFDHSANVVNEVRLTQMRDAMAHRGPDGAGIWLSSDKKVGFGHRRLAIIDPTESANQPMVSPDGRYSLIYNGEIYNHSEIRNQLIALGHHKWQTDHSDTEVLLHAFMEWGIACVEQFRGMFAFAIWDRDEQVLWLCRDHIGIKPLYYCQSENRLIFASEIKAILADPRVPRAANEEALFHYLSFLVPPAPMTMFAGIEKLPAATWMRIGSNGSVTTKRYWSPFQSAVDYSQFSEEELAEKVYSELETSVAMRKISDVPVGVFLSGGVDSTTNAAMFAKGESSSVKTFAIGYDEHYSSNPSELPYARQAAEFVGAEHFERELTQADLLSFLPEMIRLQDEPIADPVCVPVYYVSKLARDNGVIVAQVGEGADELFCGYRNWDAVLRAESLLQRPFGKVLNFFGRMVLALTGRSGHRFADWLRRHRMGVPLFWGGAEAFSHPEKMALLSPRLRSRYADETSWNVLEPIYERFCAEATDRSAVNWMTYLDLNLRLPELLLMRVDKMSMGVSLEGRVPFLDHKFVELAMQIPASVKYKPGQLKRLLKKAVKGRIPDSILERKKQGFGVPVDEWFMRELGDEAKEKILAFCRKTDLLDQREVERRFKHPDGRTLWYLLNLALWHEAYIEQFETPKPAVAAVQADIWGEVKQSA